MQVVIQGEGDDREVRITVGGIEFVITEADRAPCEGRGIQLYVPRGVLQQHHGTYNSCEFTTWSE